MQKKSAENKNLFFTSTVYTFPLIILLLTLLVFVFFHPGIRPRWDQNYRIKIFNNFLETTIIEKELDPQAYWLFRERYSPGTFVPNQEVVGFFQTFKITGLEESKTTDLLFYNSPFLLSSDSITSDKDVLTKIKEQNTEQVLLSSETILITEFKSAKDLESKIVNLWFLLPIEEMRLANGFFDYTADELELLEKGLWLNHSKIILF